MADLPARGLCVHYNDFITGAIASQITSLTIAYSNVYSGADQRKHQSSASLAFVRGIHRGPVDAPHKWPVTRECFHLTTSSYSARIERNIRSQNWRHAYEEPHSTLDTRYARWRHQMDTFSALLALCVGNLPVTCEFPSQRPVMRSFGVFFDLRMNKWLSKQSKRRWFGTSSCSLWRHSNGTYHLHVSLDCLARGMLIMKK